MNSSMMIEMVGYLGSVLVLVSFLMASVVKLRVINSVGGLIFAVYALLIRSYPTALMNFCLVGINLYYLARLRYPDRHYTLIEERKDSSVLRAFLEHYAEDIAACIEKVWSDEKLRQDMIQKGYERSKKWTANAFKKRFIKIIIYELDR